MPDTEKNNYVTRVIQAVAKWLEIRSRFQTLPSKFDEGCMTTLGDLGNCVVDQIFHICMLGYRNES